MFLTRNGLENLPSPQTTELYMKTGEVLLLCKAYNGRVVMQWLTEVVAQAAETEPYKSADDTISIVALAMLLKGIRQEFFGELWGTHIKQPWPSIYMVILKKKLISGESEPFILAFVQYNHPICPQWTSMDILFFGLYRQFKDLGMMVLIWKNLLNPIYGV